MIALLAKVIFVLIVGFVCYGIVKFILELCLIIAHDITELFGMFFRNFFKIMFGALIVVIMLSLV
jgi:hypothetical protein